MCYFKCKTKEIKNPNYFSYVFNAIMYVNNKIIAFVHERDVLSAVIINPETTAKQKYVTVLDGIYGKGVSIFYSNDKSKILLVHSENASKNENAKFHFKIIDENLSLIDEKIIEFPYVLSSFRNLKITLESDNDILIASSINQSGENYLYKLFSYSFKEEKLKEQAIKTTGKYMYDISIFKSLDKKQIIVTGLFAIDKPRWSDNKRETNGCIISFYDIDSLKILNTEEENFEDNNLYITHSILNPNNTVTLVFENNSKNSFTYNTNYGESLPTNHNTKDTYEYGPILIKNFNLKGNLNWSSIVMESQMINKNSYYASFGLINNGNSLNFILNDSKEKLSKRNAEVYTVDESGKASQNPTEILNGKKSGITIACSVNRKIDTNTYIFIASKNRLVKMTIK